MATPNERLRSYRESMPSRAVPGEVMGRAELAEAVNRYIWETTGKRHQLDAHTIARYERGVVRWPNAAYRWGLRAVLDVASDADLGFYPTRRGNSQSPPRSGTAPGKAFDVRARVELHDSPSEFLANTTVETPVPTRLGWTEVEHVRATTQAVAMSENLFGGGLSCEAATAQLRWAGRLLDVRAAREVHLAMAEAVGNLAGVVGYSAFDIANYAAADRCFAFALWCADASGSWSLRANTLADMARKAVYLGELDYALELIEFAEVRSDRLTATARAMLATIRARLLALTGRHAEACADIDRADGHFADHDASADPPWLCYYDAAEHHGSTGKALIPIAQVRSRPELATRRLDEVIRWQGVDYPRSRTFSRIRLATLLMNTGYPEDALSVGHQAVIDSASLRSKRLLTELQGLAGAADAYSHLGDVAELRHAITRMSHPET